MKLYSEDSYVTKIIRSPYSDETATSRVYQGSVRPGSISMSDKQFSIEFILSVSDWIKKNGWDK